MSENHDRPVSRDELVSTVKFALGKAQRLWPKRRLPGDHDRFEPLARAIVDHLELCRLRCLGKWPGNGSKTPDPEDCAPDDRGRKGPAPASGHDAEAGGRQVSRNGGPWSQR